MSMKRIENTDDFVSIFSIRQQFLTLEKFTSVKRSRIDWLTFNKIEHLLTDLSAKSIFKQNEICYNQSMRLDKFLKVSRLIKRRPVAKEVADKGRIKINGKLAKSSSDVKFNDIIEIRFGNKIVEVRVIELKEFTRKEDADKMYELISETRVKAEDEL